MKEGSKYQPLLDFLCGSEQNEITLSFRQDADDHLRFLRRTIPNGGFEIMFEPPDDVKEDLNI